MTIFFYKELTRNPKIRNTPVWVFPNIWRLGQARDATFGANLFNDSRVTAFIVSELLRENQQGLNVMA